MSWWGVGVAVGGMLLSSQNSSNAADSAAQAQTQSSQASIDEARRQYDLTRSDQAPYREAGTTALDRLRTLMGIGPGAPLGDVTTSPLLRPFNQADLSSDPVYTNGLQFGLDRGTQGINQRALQAGNYDSGATLKALTQFGNDYGTSKAGDAYNRFVGNQGNIYNKLAGVTGTGQTATNQTQAAGQNMTNTVTGALTDQGNARAAGIVGGANAWGGGLQQASNIYNQSLQNQRFNALMGGGSGYGSGTYTNPGAYNIDPSSFASGWV